MAAQAVEMLTAVATEQRLSQSEILVRAASNPTRPIVTACLWGHALGLICLSGEWLKDVQQQDFDVAGNRVWTNPKTTGMATCISGFKAFLQFFFDVLSYH